MAKSVFGDPFSSGRTSGAGRGTSLSSDNRGRATKPEEEVDWSLGPATFGEQGWRYEEKRDRRRMGQLEDEDEADFPTVVEMRAEKEAAKAAREEERRADEKRRAEEERLKAEEAQRKAEEAQRKAEEAQRNRGTKPVSEEGAPPSPSPVAPENEKQLKDADIKARQEIARRVRMAIGADDPTEAEKFIEDERKKALGVGVTDEAFNSFLERERGKASPEQLRSQQEQLRARQQVATRIRAALRSDDQTAIETAFEDAVAAGVAPGDVRGFIDREEQALAQRGEVRAGTLFGEPSNLDSYYGAQTEKSRGIPLGYRSGKSKPIAPDWRIHTRLYRLVNKPYSDRPGAGTRLSPEAAAMLYEQKTGRKLAFDRPIEYTQQQQDRRAKNQAALEAGMPLPTPDYGFGRR